MEHDHEELKPQLISTWMPNGIGAMPGKRVIFAETQVCMINNVNFTFIFSSKRKKNILRIFFQNKGIINRNLIFKGNFQVNEYIFTLT